MVRIGPLNIGTFELVGLAIAVPVILGFSRAGGIAAATGFGAGIGRAIATPVPSLTDFLVSIGLITPNGKRDEQKEAQEGQERTSQAQLDALRRKQREDEERLEGIARRTRERIAKEGRALAPATTACPPGQQFYSEIGGCSTPSFMAEFRGSFGRDGARTEVKSSIVKLLSPSFIIPAGAFDVSEIASRLGYRGLSPQQAQRISLGQTGLGALIQAFRRGEISEDVLRSGFRETIR